MPFAKLDEGLSAEQKAVDRPWIPATSKHGGSL